MRGMLPPFVVLVVLLFCTTSSAALRAGDFEYREGETVLQGYLAYDDSVQGKRPGVLVVHEWTGIGPYVKHRVEQLAGMGYVALAADIYGKGVRPKNAAEAGRTMTIYRNDRALLRARVRAGLEALLKQPSVDPTRVAAIGYCFGGMTVLELARSGADIAGVVSFHGVLDTPTPEDARNIKAKVLVLSGGDDPNVPMEQVAAFVKEMRAAHVNWELTLYGGTVHSFTNPDAGNDPSKGAAYNAQADRRSWQAMRDFFREILGAAR